MTTNKRDPYEILKFLIPRLGSPSHFGPWNIHSPRLEALRDLIKPLELTEEVFQDGKRVNFYIRLQGLDTKRDTTVFVAHSDVVDPEHCVSDNSSSVCNLIALAHRLIGKETKNNLLIAFTDGEEVGGIGAKVLARQINSGSFGEVSECINVEMSGVGEKWFVDGDYGLADEVGFTKLDTPFSDATILRNEGINCLTIGTLPEAELQEVLDEGYCDIWGVCHSPRDVFSLANREDMNAFVNELERYLTK